MAIERITVLCFGASYGAALILELAQLLRAGKILRLLALLFGGAGLVAHTLFLVGHRVPLASQPGALLYPAWILAVFYLIGSIHYRRLTWGVFVLPVVLCLSMLAGVFLPGGALFSAQEESPLLSAHDFWRGLHIALFVLAAVGISVGFVASTMYLVQARRLKAKALPGQGMRLLSLERLETMNRRAINIAFPLLTVGLLVGMAQMAYESEALRGWTDPRVLSTLILWLVFAVVLYLRYGFRVRGRRVALLTIVAFALLLLTLVTSHSFRPGGAP